MSKPAINPNEVGDLVPMLSYAQDNWKPVLTDATYDAHLKELVHKTPAVRNRWSTQRLPLGRDSFFERGMSSIGYFCAVQLAETTVGVLKIEPVTGHCTLFVRLKRATWLAWAQKNKVDSNKVDYAFHKPLDPQVSSLILRGAHVFELETTGVHHPWVLALLCTMSANDWLDYVVERDSSYDNPTTKIGNFNLVALPPLPAEFEQCLGIMGHSEAFVDADATLSSLTGTTALDALWGNHVAGERVVDSCAHLFAQGASRMPSYADEKLFAKTLPDLDENSQYAWEVLQTLRAVALASATSSSSSSSAAASPPAAAPAAAPPAEMVCDVSLLDSDDSDDGDDAPPPPPPRATATLAASRKRSAPSKAKAAPARKKRASSDSDDDDNDSDEDSSASDDTSEEDDDDDSSSDESLREEDAQSSAPSSPAATATTAVAPVPPPSSSSSALTTVPTAQGPMSDPALLTVLTEMAKPCCERLKKLKRGCSVGLTARHDNQLSDDLKLLETATSPVALLAAALSIVTTLADIQTDRFRGEEAQRLSRLAAQAGEFAEGVRALLDSARED